MLRTVCRDIARARAMPRRSPLTKVRCAECIATSVPVPIAMPTSAFASAGASLMPSPAIATLRPSACKRLDELHLVGRLDFADHFVDAEPRCNRARGGPAVAGGHHDTHAVCAQLGQRLRRCCLDRVRDCEQSRQLAVDRQKHHARALLAQLLGGVAQRMRSQLFRRASARCCQAQVAGRRLRRARRCRSRIRRFRLLRAPCRVYAPRRRSHAPEDVRNPDRDSPQDAAHRPR